MNDVRKHKEGSTDGVNEGEVQKQIEQYKSGDEVIYKTNSGKWETGRLQTQPNAVRARGKTVFEFKIEGVKEWIKSSTPLRKIEGADLVAKFKNEPIILDNRKYTLNGANLGPNGEEEFSLQDVDSNEHVRFVSAETLRNIAEAGEAVKNVQKKVRELMEKIDSLEGIKVKDLIKKATGLETKAKEIANVLGSTKEWNDLEQSEVVAMAAEVAKLRKDAEKELRQLRDEVAGHKEAFEGNTDVARKRKIAQEIENIAEKKIKLAARVFETKGRKDLATYNRESEQIRVWEQGKKSWEAIPRNRGRKYEDETGKTQPQRSVENKPLDPASEEFKNAKLFEAVREYRKKHPSELVSLDGEVKEKLADDAELVAISLSEAEAVNYKRVAKEKSDAESDEIKWGLRKNDLDGKVAIANNALTKLEAERDPAQKKYDAYIVRTDTQTAKLAKAKGDLKDFDLREKALVASSEAKKREIEILKNEIQIAGIKKSLKTSKEARITTLEAEIAENDGKLQKIATDKKPIQDQFDDLQTDPEVVEIRTLKKRLEEISTEKGSLASEVATLTAEKQQIETDLKAAEDLVVEKEKSLAEIRKKANLAELTQNATVEVVKAWAELKDDQAAKFDFKKEKSELEAKVEQLKDDAKKIVDRKKREAKIAELDQISEKLDELSPTNADLVNTVLKYWKDVGKSEVEIFELKPREIPGKVREAREKKEGGTVFVELPSSFLKEILGSVPDRKVAEVMNLIYQKQLSEGVEDGVTVVYGDGDITKAIGTLFDGPKPYFGTLDKLRDFGIKDWDKFKLLWKEQYASQIGIILQEEAQKKVKKIFETARAGEDGVWEVKKAAWEEKEADFQKEMQEYQSRRSTKNPIKRWFLNRTFEKPPQRAHSEKFDVKPLSDEEVRKRIVDGLLNQAKAGGKEILTTDAFNTLTRLMATAMREINLEIKVSEADTEQEKNRLLGEASRSADQYVDYNGQFYIKNMDQRASREGAAEEDGAEVNPEMYKIAYNELADLMNEMNDILNEMQKGAVSKAQADKIAEAAKNLRAAFEGQDEADKMHVRVLGEDFTMQDEAKDLLYEYTKLKDRERTTESFRVARDIIKERGKEIAKADEAHGGVAAKVVEHTAPLHEETTPHAPAAKKAAPKSNRWKNAALLAGVLCMGLGTYYIGRKSSDSQTNTPTVSSQRVGEPPRGGISGGGGQQLDLTPKRNLDASKTTYSAGNLANQELPNLPLAGLDFPETMAASNLTDIDARGNEALVSLLSTVEQDNSIEAKAKADILGKIARGYAKLGNDDDARFKSEVLKSAKNWKAESDAGKKKALLDGVLDTVVKLGTGPARKPNT